jgi:hypothetical protein
MDGRTAEGDVAHTVLNRECFCITLERDELHSAIRAQAGDAESADALLAARPHLFSEGPVFLSAKDLSAMLEVAAAIEAASATPAYRQAVLGWAPSSAQHDFGPRGVFMGYDFHLGGAQPRLIEVNTNAGGAFLNALLAQAQSACCREVMETYGVRRESGFEAAVRDMFLAEWALQGRPGQPRSIAIVDDRPTEQYLYPEFLLARSMFARHGIEAVIADPGELEYVAGDLIHHGRRIDMVYNRLVDFGLEEASHDALRRAYLDGAVVVTPNPHNHALLADKRNLTFLSDPDLLREIGLSDEHRSSLAAVPRTVPVDAGNAEALWAGRKGWFFKPATGYGGKAVYRGDKITRTAWSQVTGGGYIAQEIAPPGERRVRVDGQVQSLKVDVRLYTYRAELLIAAARVYQGQTTNFRTPGGGFAPVYTV